MRPLLIIIIIIAMVPIVSGMAVVNESTAWGHCKPMPDAAAMRRAWRRLSLENHPDKAGGSTDQFLKLSAGRDAVASPLLFSLRYLFQEGLRSHAPPSSRYSVSHARAVVASKGGWPYLTLEMTLEGAQPGVDTLEPGSTWSMGIGLSGVSSIEYKGNEENGGYDVCCDLVADSKCKRAPLPYNVTTTDVPSEGRALNVEPYIVHDCPIKLPSTFRVHKPLHIAEVGDWGVTFSLWAEGGSDLACVVIPVALQHPTNATIANATNATKSTAHQGQRPRGAARDWLFS